MTREQAKSILPVIQAWAEGKEVQYRSKTGPTTEWVDAVTDPTFQSYSLEWRVKPEKPENQSIKAQLSAARSYLHSGYIPAAVDQLIGAVEALTNRGGIV